MLGQCRFVGGAGVEGDLGVVEGAVGVVVDGEVPAALEMALPRPRPTPMVPPVTARPIRTFANRLLMLAPVWRSPWGSSPLHRNTAGWERTGSRLSGSGEILVTRSLYEPFHWTRLLRVGIPSTRHKAAQGRLPGRTDLCNGA
jgi:hypothetical protein